MVAFPGVQMPNCIQYYKENRDVLSHKKYRRPLLVSSLNIPLACSLKIICFWFFSGFFLNFWCSHLYKVNSSLPFTSSNMESDILLSTISPHQKSFQLVVLHYIPGKNRVLQVKLGW